VAEGLKLGKDQINFPGLSIANQTSSPVYGKPKAKIRVTEVMNS
jgi:hypothetical protein